MKWLVILIASGLAGLGVATKIRPEHAKASGKISFQHFAILELFTSEGCSSCPPADRLLPQLAAIDASVIPLSFHVDYWDRLGWKDPFSDHQFTNRQNEYGEDFKLESIYTPQLIINGQYELVGSNKSAAENDIKKLLAETATVTISIDQVAKSADKLSVSCRLTGSWNKSTLLAAVIEKHAATEVKGGENKGAKLSHTNIVRTFLSKVAGERMKFEIENPKGISDDNWELVLYTQNSNLNITGAALYDPHG